MMRYSCCPLPALRWVIVASLMCSPVAHAFRSSGVALSIPWTIDRSRNVALPAPPPPPGAADPEFATPQENESTSISFLCLESRDSPYLCCGPPSRWGSVVVSVVWPRSGIRAWGRWTAVGVEVERPQRSEDERPRG